MSARTETLDDDALFERLPSTMAAISAAGFVRDTHGASSAVQHPTWIRVRGEGDDADADKVVLWRHPRVRTTLHGYVATTRVGDMVHLRFFDPSWQPETVLPGHLEKGWELADLAAADAALESVWDRALAWFESPVPADRVMAQDGRLAALVAPGPMLERHRRRAGWLAEQGRDAEAAHVRALIARIEALFER